MVSSGSCAGTWDLGDLGAWTLDLGLAHSVSKAWVLGPESGEAGARELGQGLGVGPLTGAFDLGDGAFCTEVTEVIG